MLSAGKKVAAWRNFRPLSTYLWQMRVGYGLGFLCVILANGFALAIPWLLKHVVDGLGSGGALWAFASAILAAALLQAIFVLFSRQIVSGYSRRIEYTLRNDLFNHLQRLSLSYFQRMHTGDLMSRMTNDLLAVQRFLGPGIRNLFNTVVTYSTTITMMLIIDVPLTLYALIPYPLLAITINRVSAYVHRGFREVQQQFSRLSMKAQENLAGVRVVRAYVQEEPEQEEFGQLSLDYMRKNLELMKVSGLMLPVMIFLGGVGTVIVLWLGGNRVIAGTITLGEFVAFSGYLAMLLWPTIALGWIINLYQRAAASMGRIKEILEEQPEIRDTTCTLPVHTLRGEIEFRDLNFAYGGDGCPDNGFALRGITAKIPVGGKLGIIGPTGSGKSTLVNLIPRLYRVHEGMLFIDNIDINLLPLQVVRQHIGFVPQEPFLFSESIGSNIAFGCHGDPSQEAVVRAATLASLMEDIREMPQGIDTILGERGINLSGGQKQRAAIARAVAVQPLIMILDDPFSSVDARTEGAILIPLRQAMEGRTTIIVSHRVSTVQHADQIIVLDRGRIADRGTHEELLARGGFYARLWQQQRLALQLQGELEAL